MWTSEVQKSHVLAYGPVKCELCDYIGDEHMKCENI